MIGSKGYKGNSFKDSLSYKIPKITIADVVDEMLENSKKRQEKKDEKNKSIEK